MKMIKQNESLNWKRVLTEKVQPAFLSPCQEQTKEDEFKDIVTDTLKNVNDLKDDGKDKKPFLGKGICYIEDENSIAAVKKKANIPEKSTSMKEVIKEASKYFNGMFNWAHPKAMVNVTPPAAIPSFAGSLMGSMLNPNIVEQEYSGNVAVLEIEVASIISKLIGYDCKKSTGHFTFGGTGAYLFATKLALTKCLGKESRTSGIRKDAQILVSKVGHYAMKNCSDWTGLGTNNVRTINLNEDSSMNLDRKSTHLNSSHANISYAVFCLKKKNNKNPHLRNVDATNALLFLLRDCKLTDIGDFLNIKFEALYSLLGHSTRASA